MQSLPHTITTGVLNKNFISAYAHACLHTFSISLNVCDPCLLFDTEWAACRVYISCRISDRDSVTSTCGNCVRLHGDLRADIKMSSSHDVTNNETFPTQCIYGQYRNQNGHIWKQQPCVIGHLPKCNLCR